MSEYYQFRDETGTPIDYYELVNDNNELCKENEQLKSQLQQKENIIKEVREYGESCMNEILSTQIEENPYKFTLYVCLAVHRRYLEILDKENSNE